MVATMAPPTDRGGSLECVEMAAMAPVKMLRSRCQAEGTPMVLSWNLYIMSCALQGGWIGRSAEVGACVRFDDHWPDRRRLHAGDRDEISATGESGSGDSSRGFAEDAHEDRDGAAGIGGTDR